MDWIATSNGIITLISGLIGLITTGIGAYWAIKNFIALTKEKNKNEIWAMIMNIADAAMHEAEATEKTGADKKVMVIESVKAGCKAAGLDINEFLDKLSDYIDTTIDFVNKMNNSQK